MRIFILGLRRSGTTIFWESFRQDPRLWCVNEPFNPYLADLPVELPNRSRREMIELFQRDPRDFWRRFAPIHPFEELQPGFSDRQAAYLRYLLEGRPGFCTDVTRCHFKLEGIHEIAPDAAVVHLYRQPAAFASSHLIPTGSGGFRTGRLEQRLWRLGFFTRDRRFNRWGLEAMIGRHPDSLFGQHLRGAGLDPAQVYPLPGVGRLLAFWRVAFETVERDGPRLFGERFVSVPFERFCREPREVVERVYAAAGGSVPELDLSRVRPAKAPHRAADPRWGELLAKVGIPEALR